MTIPQPPNLEPTDSPDYLDFVVGAPPPPNHDTDGTNGKRTDPRDCVCGHAKADHEPLKRPDNGEATWQCLYCGCTRAYPGTPVPSH